MNALRPPEHEQLSSGKTIMRLFNQDGSLYEETHSYGVIDIGISFKFREGKKIEETYLVKSRLVSRRTYEKARVGYSDMPAPDAVIEDWAADLLKRARQQERQHQAEAKCHVANREEADRLDNFCIDMMQSGKRSEVTKWLEARDHTLGELDWTGSRRLVKSLSSLGCVKIFVCEITCDAHGENAGHLVIELPKAQSKRENILKKVDELAREQGYDGPFDDGQRYTYVKLD